MLDVWTTTILLRILLQYYAKEKFHNGQKIQESSITLTNEAGYVVPAKRQKKHNYMIGSHNILRIDPNLAPLLFQSIISLLEKNFMDHAT